jgi:hypothetical protein
MLSMPDAPTENTHGPYSVGRVGVRSMEYLTGVKLNSPGNYHRSSGDPGVLFVPLTCNVKFLHRLQTL